MDNTFRLTRVSLALAIHGLAGWLIALDHLRRNPPTEFELPADVIEDGRHRVKLLRAQLLGLAQILIDTGPADEAGRWRESLRAHLQRLGPEPTDSEAVGTILGLVNVSVPFEDILAAGGAMLKSIGVSDPSVPVVTDITDGADALQRLTGYRPPTP